jgi:hypothetical protein
MSACIILGAWASLFARLLLAGAVFSCCRSNAVRVLCQIVDGQLLAQIERYLKQAVVDKSPVVAASVLVSALHLIKNVSKSKCCSSSSSSNAQGMRRSSSSRQRSAQMQQVTAATSSASAS